MGKRLLKHPLALLAIGLCAGALARWMDIYTQNLGDVFSKLAVWILIGTLIAIYSDAPGRAAANTLAFCLGMLAAYYAVAMLTHDVYSWRYIIVWTAFALCVPLLAVLTWMTRRWGAAGCVIRVGIVAVSALSSVLLFGGFGLDDLIIDGGLVCLLFFAGAHRDGDGGRSRSGRG